MTAQQSLSFLSRAVVNLGTPPRMRNSEVFEAICDDYRNEHAYNTKAILYTYVKEYIGLLRQVEREASKIKATFGFTF